MHTINIKLVEYLVNCITKPQRSAMVTIKLNYGYHEENP